MSRTFQKAKFEFAIQLFTQHVHLSMCTSVYRLIQGDLKYMGVLMCGYWNQLPVDTEGRPYMKFIGSQLQN